MRSTGGRSKQSGRIFAGNLFRNKWLQDTYESIAKNPISEEALGHIRDIIQQLLHYEVRQAHQAIATRCDRSWVILSTAKIWYWLDVTLPYTIREDFTNVHPGSTIWLVVMMTTIDLALLSRQK